MNDSEQYHTGRAAAYDTIAHLAERGWSAMELRDLARQRQMDAERDADAAKRREAPGSSEGLATAPTRA